mgnify:CR=1 FL=1
MDFKNIETPGQKSEEMDSDFLQELNSLTSQLKTDEEIQSDFKSNKSSDNVNEKEKKENNINENPFNEAFNIMNSKNQNCFGDEMGNTLFESLFSMQSKMNQFNSLLNNSLNEKNNHSDNNTTKGDSDTDDKQKQILEEILDFLIQSNLLKDTILNMKKSIENAFEKNKDNLNPEENKKYEEALSNANNIIDEIDKVHPDRSKIMDSLHQLQQISNDIDSILKV